MSNACMHAKRVGLEENTTWRFKIFKIVNLPLLLVNLMYISPSEKLMKLV